MRVIATYQEQCRVVDISTELGITVGAASKLVDRLERAGLSERVANPGDRRSSLVRLSEAGRRLQRSAAAVVAHALQVLLAPVRNDAPVLVASLQSLRRHLRQLDKEEPSP
jgi:DNA-binding MarR family transcriptional regulator